MANGKESDPALSTIAPEAPVTSERPVDVYKLGIPYPRMFIFFSSLENQLYCSLSRLCLLQFMIKEISGFL
jgi:hypothetical protein